MKPRNLIGRTLDRWSELEAEHTARLNSFQATDEQGDKSEFMIYFEHRGRVVTYTRYAYIATEAVRQAQDGFQWRFGYHPGEPTAII